MPDENPNPKPELNAAGLEENLRAALQREDPPRDLAPGVLRRIASVPVSATPRRRWRWLWLPATAMALLVTVMGINIQQRRAAEREAGMQLIQALQVASDSLVSVQRQVQSQVQPPSHP